jgi:hypothetical protein
MMAPMPKRGEVDGTERAFEALVGVRLGLQGGGGFAAENFHRKIIGKSVPTGGL